MNWRTNVLLTTVFMLVSTSLLATEEKTLKIERYPNEPMQLVDLKIGDQSIKDRIESDFKGKVTQWGTDQVRFTEADDWYRRLTFTFKNVSDKPIEGVQAILLFKPAGQKMLFSAPVTQSKLVGKKSLDPGDMIELSVPEEQLNTILERMRQAGADPQNSEVSFSLDSVRFSEELRWYRGSLVHPDPAVPNKWIPVSKPAP